MSIIVSAHALYGCTLLIDERDEECSASWIFRRGISRLIKKFLLGMNLLNGLEELSKGRSFFGAKRNRPTQREKKGERALRRLKSGRD